MNILTQIALLSGLVACISLLWLAGRAFIRHLGWGLAVLFLSPLAATLFGIRYWRDEKGPFLVHITTLAVAVTVGLYLFAANGGWNELRNALRDQQPTTVQTTGRATGMNFVPTSLKVDKQPEMQAQEGDMTGVPPGQTQVARQISTESTTNTSPKAITGPAMSTVASAKPVEPKQNLRARYLPIDPSLAGDYVGMTVKVKRRNRPEQDCMLKHVSSTALGFEQHTRGGTFSFEYRQSDIEKLRVLVKQVY